MERAMDNLGILGIPSGQDGARKRAGGDLRKKAARARNRTCTPAVGKAGIKTVMVGVSKSVGGEPWEPDPYLGDEEFFRCFYF